MYLDYVKEQCETNETLRELMAFDPPKPCTEAEVRFLQRVLGLVLPCTYTEFLLWMGHGGGTLLPWAPVVFYDRLLPIQEGAQAHTGRRGGRRCTARRRLCRCPVRFLVLVLPCLGRRRSADVFVLATISARAGGRITQEFGRFSEFLWFWIGAAAACWELDKDAAIPF